MCARACVCVCAGKVIKVKEWQPEFGEGLESGLLVDGVTWQYLTQKQSGIMSLLSIFADKYFTIRAVLEKRAGTTKGD